MKKTNFPASPALAKLPLVACVTLSLALAGIGCGSAAATYIAKGDSLYSKAQYLEASINYRKALQKNNSSAEALHKLGLSEYQQGLGQEALAALTQAHQLAPKDLGVYQDLTDVTFSRYLISGRTQNLYEESSAMVADLLKNYPNSPVGLRLHAALLYGDGKLRESIAEYRKADALDPFDPAVLLPLADALRLDNRLPEAEEVAQQLIVHVPLFTQTYDWLSEAYLTSGHPDQAEQVLKTRIKNNWKDFAPILTLASFYRSQGRPAEASAEIDGLIARASDFPNRYMLAGEFYRSERNWTKAEDFFQKGIVAQPSSKSACLTSLAAMYVAQKRSPEALAALNQAVAASPGNLTAQGARISLLIASGNKQKVNEALSSATAIIKLKPEDPRFHYLQANAYLALNDEKSAIASFLEAARIGARIIPPRLALAVLSKQKHDPEGMLRYSSEVLAVTPDDPKARLIHADGLMAQGNFVDADQEMKTLLKDFPGSADVRLDAALLFLAEKKTRAAIESFKALLEARPDDQRALTGLVTAYMQQGSADIALGLVSEQVKKDPGSEQKRRLLAAVALKLQKPDIALAQYEALAQAHPDSPDYQFELGKMYEYLGDKKKALVSYETAARLAPTDAVKAGRLALAYDANGMAQQADETYSRALKLSPADPILLNDRAYFLADTGRNPDEAIRLAKNALQRMPDNPALKDTLALSYIAKGIIPDATGILDPLVRSHPDEAMFRYHLAMALVRSGSRDEAKKQLQMSLSRKPSPDDEIRIRKLLLELG